MPSLPLPYRLALCPPVDLPRLLEVLHVHGLVDLALNTALRVRALSQLNDLCWCGRYARLLGLGVAEWERPGIQQLTCQLSNCDP